MIGKKIRLSRILRGDLRTTIVAVDHGLTSGPIQGINQLRNLLPKQQEETQMALYSTGVLSWQAIGIPVGLLA